MQYPNFWKFALKILLEEVTRFVLDQTAFLHDIIEQFAGLDVLHDHVDVRRGLHHLVETDDVGVHEETQDLDLPTDFFLHVHRFDLLAVEDLNGDFVAGKNMFC